MYDVISIGSIAVDMFFSGESFTFKEDRFQLAVGGKYVGDHFHTSIGGGGANVAIGTAKHGLKSAVLGTIGENSFKKMILQNLEAFRVATKLCNMEKEYYNVSTIILTPKGERTVIHYSSPHQHILGANLSIHKFIDTKILYLGNMPDVSLAERETTLNLSRKNNTVTVLNLGVKDCRRPKRQLHALLNKTDILIINGHEFAELVKAPYKDLHFAENVVKWYIPELDGILVIITEGKKGSYGYIGNQVLHQKALPVDLIADTTGAGDAYTAGFIAGYFKSKNVERAMEKGAEYASRILSKIGAN